MKTMIDKDQISQAVSAVEDSYRCDFDWSDYPEIREHNLSELSDLIVDSWNELGYVVMSEDIREAAEVYGLQWNGNLSFKQANERYLKACGFSEHNAPLSFPYGGNGDCVWLLELSADQEKSLVSAILHDEL
jgi:hypothetical protein